ncbi:MULTISPECIES: hypothetical protein [unclassified Saccharopolyspora]|uniref:hypothetical protein n=1 Tax=unclassified Saccharopolyspora TaxID=2646250 RepID=UPI001CD27368|nr:MULTISPECIES: hypothetical protein [unclassified Saccharopolyspora]MCA1189404.1 hypothetical protein [Saccharopolyspora sp. 6T]MCA1191243.1 hypothetical protein [Saccharopolyspora sp. 6V]MCA1228691.1 hypothetical protein [Saccharopolyspora sp. 6M]MCA1282661.1 hypothetical protein [Saccharopolyspora sp. 7B]
MAPPNGEGIKTALDAMHTDAALWREQAEAMNGPKQAVEAVKIEPGQRFFLSDELGLDDTLEELRVAIGSLIDQGQQYFNKVADDLTAAAQQYQADDDAAMQKLHDLLGEHP